MGEPQRVPRPRAGWPVRGTDRELATADREPPTASWPPRAARPGDREARRPRGADREPPTARSDRELDREDRELPTARWPLAVDDHEDREDREGGTYVRLVKTASPPPPPEVDDEDDVVALPRWLSPLDEFRFVRSTAVTADHIEYARDGAYSTRKDGPLRYANIAFAHTIAAVGTLLCDSVKWAFFERLSRCLAAIPILLALLWALNHVPVIAWLIPDGWDFTTWWPFADATPDALPDMSGGE